MYYVLALQKNATKKGEEMSEKITIAEARRMRNVSQSEAAKHLGISLGSYRNKELGRSKFYVDEAYSMCKLLGIKMDEIFFGNSGAEKWNEKEKS